MMAINLLPWRERHRARRRRVFIAGIAASASVAVAMVVFAWLVVDARIDNVRLENARLTERIATLDLRLESVADLRQRSAELVARIDTVRRLDAERVDTVRIFDELVRTLVPGLRYTALARRGEVISVRGSAVSESIVSAFMRNVERSARFGSPSLQNIADAEGQGSHAMFDLTFETARMSDGSRPAGNEAAVADAP